MTNAQKDRLAYRINVAQQLGVRLDPPLSFRAARFASLHSSRDELVHWLLRPSTVNTWQMGKKTYTELCMAFGLAVPAKAPRTVGRKLAEAQARIAELEQEIVLLKGQAAEIERLKSTICSNGNGGKSTYQNGFTGATTSLPPETRITVNGKTFTLGDIDKEMTK